MRQVVDRVERDVRRARSARAEERRLAPTGELEGIRSDGHRLGEGDGEVGVDAETLGTVGQARLGDGGESSTVVKPRSIGALSESGGRRPRRR